jgi:hypothetical protein
MIVSVGSPHSAPATTPLGRSTLLRRWLHVGDEWSAGGTVSSSAARPSTDRRVLVDDA